MANSTSKNKQQLFIQSLLYPGNSYYGLHLADTQVHAGKLEEYMVKTREGFRNTSGDNWYGEAGDTASEVINWFKEHVWLSLFSIK